MRVHHPPSPLQAAPTGHDAGQRLVANAMRFQGQPFRWGGGHGGRVGVQPVDCSGLITQAAQLSGLRLGGTARDLQRTCRPVSMRALQPGDLVFRGHPAHHTGIYIGNGQVLHAPSTGRRVSVTGLGIWHSAGRPAAVNRGAPVGEPPQAQPRRRRPAPQGDHYQPHPRRHVARQAAHRSD